MGLFNTKKAEPPKYLVYSPKDDITAFEVAQCLKIFVAQKHGKSAMLRAYHDMPKTAQRHFKIIKDKGQG